MLNYWLLMILYCITISHPFVICTLLLIINLKTDNIYKKSSFEQLNIQ